MAGAFPTGNRLYRRGLVLGLTLAELFLILLFLFLLLLAIFAPELKSDEQDERNEPDKWVVDIGIVREENARLKQELDQLQKKIDDLEPLATVTREFREMSGRTLGEVLDLVMLIGDDWDEIVAMVRADKEMLRLRKRVEELGRREKRLLKALAEMRSLVDAGRRVPDSSNATGMSQSEIAATILEVERLRSRLEAVIAENTSMAAKIASMATSTDESGNEKGIDPACWDESPSSDGDNDKRLYVHLFDVAVFDEHIMVRDRDVPEQFAEEKGSLPLDKIRFMQEMDDEEFLTVMRPIEEMGKTRKIRDYYCIFYVHVYDQTSAASKRRWQKGVDAIGQRFYLTVKYGEEWNP